MRLAGRSQKAQLIEFTYELDGAVGGSLVALLAVEEETLSGLSSPRGNVVGNICNLVGLERGDRLDIDGLGTEPEESLGVDEVPASIR